MTEPTTTGAMSGGGATPPAAPVTPPATPPDPKPATGDDQLGEGGKAALKEERAARATAERERDALTKELETLRGSTQSDSERAVAQARREAEAAERAKWQDRIRAVEVRGALRGAGLVNDHFLALATSAPEFKELTVADDGTVSGVTAAIEQFRTNYPEAFPKAGGTSPGTVAAGPQTPPTEVKPGMDRLTAAYASNAGKRT
jgi:hypothetical protein